MFLSSQNINRRSVIYTTGNHSNHSQHGPPVVHNQTLVSRGQTLYQTQSEKRVRSSEGGCAVPDTRIPGENVVLIIAPNYHKSRIRSVCDVLSAEVAYLSWNEAEKKLGVTLDEVLEIHKDSYLCRFHDMTF